MNVTLSKSQKIKLLNSADIYTVMQQVLLRENKIDRNKEHFWTIGLDGDNRILYIELISLGTSKSVPVEPMQVFRVGVLKAAVKMILVHNHPSGNLRHSTTDTDTTDLLIQVGNILGIEVIDSLIISETGYNSFEDTGLLAQIKQSTRYVPNYKQQEKLRKEQAQALKEAAADATNKKAKAIAQQLKNKGFTLSQIVELTGITEEEAKKLKAKKK